MILLFGSFWGEAYAILLVGPSQTSSSVTVQTSKTIYQPGESVSVVGKVAQVEPGLDIGISVRRTDGQLWAVAQTSPNSNGEYSKTIARLGDKEQLGTYNLTVSYGGAKTSATFSVASTTTLSLEAEGEKFLVSIFATAIESNLVLEREMGGIRYQASGVAGSTGFANVTIPKKLLSGTLSVLVDGNVTPHTERINATHTFVYFTYKMGENSIAIRGTNIIPEFPLLFTSGTLAVAISVILIALSRFKRIMTPSAKLV